MQTAMQQLIDEIVEHLTYDDDLTDESRNTLEKIRIKCIDKLEMEKQQIIHAFYSYPSCPLTAEEFYNKIYKK